MLVNQVKKAYSELDNALTLYMAKNTCNSKDCIYETGITTEEITNRLFKQFQTAKLCKKGSKEKDCQTTNIKSKQPINDGKGKNGYEAALSAPYIVAANGSVFKIEAKPTCPREYETNVKDENGNFVDADNDGQFDTETQISNTCAVFYFDANGTQKGPNQFGADVYRIYLYYGGIITLWPELKNVLSTGKLNYTPYNVGDDYAK